MRGSAGNRTAVDGLQDVEKDRHLIIDVPKPYWQTGWRAQHDRLLQAASARRDRIPLFVNGDLHAIAEGRITRMPLTTLP